MNTQQRAIIERIVSDALMAGYSLEAFNGEDAMLRNSLDERDIVAALGTPQEDHLHFWIDGRRVRFVRLVYENDGWGVTQDLTPALAPLLVGARKVFEGIFSR